MDRAELTRRLLAALNSGEPLTKKDLSRALSGPGVAVPPYEINSVLYDRTDLFQPSDDSLPRWTLVQAVGAPESRPAAIRPTQPVHHAPAGYAGLRLRDWQVEAVDNWIAAGSSGVVEAVTGTGKTAVGLYATALAVDAGHKVAIVVPTVELQDQWLRQLQQSVPGTVVGRLGDGHHDSLSDCDVLLSTVHSAARHAMRPVGAHSLLIADEVHRFGAAEFRKALVPTFDWRLGLTATLEREDDAVETVLTPYFGGIVQRCSYARGLSDGILAHFRVAFVPSAFTKLEADAYEEADSTVRSSWGKLVFTYGLPAEPFGAFMAEVTSLADGPYGDPAVRAAKRYISAFNKRRTLLADAEGKVELLADIGPMIEQAGQSLIFTETKLAAQQAADTLTRAGVRTLALHSDLDRDERRSRMDQFRAGHAHALAAPRVLDEGIDVPEAELAVIMAASKSKRQMIQRMGRVIRPKADGRRAAFVVIFIPGTSEDPDLGAHEGFVDELTAVADDIRVFRGGDPGGQLGAWLESR